MENKKIHLASKLTFDFIKIFFLLFRIIPNLIFLVKLEAEIAKKNIISLIILCLIAWSLITTTWLCVMGMGFLFFVSLGLTWLMSSLIMTIINLVVLMVVGLIIVNKKSNFLFPKTKNLLRQFSCNLRM